MEVTRIKCDQCCALTITAGRTSLISHEMGCPNTGKIWDAEEERFVKPNYDGFDDEDTEWDADWREDWEKEEDDEVEEDEDEQTIFNNIDNSLERVDYLEEIEAEKMRWIGIAQNERDLDRRFGSDDTGGETRDGDLWQFPLETDD
jgi:hypothetical protein